MKLSSISPSRTIGVLLLAAAALGQAARADEWVDASGAHKIKAEFLSLDGRKLQLGRTDTKQVIAIDISVLDAGSQQRARDLDAKRRLGDIALREGMKLYQTNAIAAAARWEQGVDNDHGGCLIAMGLLSVGDHDYKQALELFEKAVAAEGIRARFLSTSKYRVAAALNNVALCQLHEATPTVAFRSMNRAVKMIAPTPAEICQNAQTFSSFVAPDAELALKDMAQALLKVLSPATGAPAFKPGLGFIYMMPDPQHALLEGTRIPTDLAVAATATGFVVAKDWVITTREFVEQSQTGRGAVYVTANRKRRQAQLPAIKSDTHDVALINVPGLPVEKPLLLVRRTIVVSEQIAVLGYPRAQKYEAALSLLKGVASKPPSDRTGGQILLNVEVGAGDSGGPVFDKRGNVLGMLTSKRVAPTTLKERRETSQFAAAVPAEALLAFASRIPSGVSSGRLDALEVGLDPAAAVARPAVLFLEMASANAVPEPRRAIAHSQWNGIIDQTCIRCSGMAKIRCPNKQCSAGAITRYRVVKIGVNPVTKQALTQNVPYKVRCTTCSGGSYVTCPLCRSQKSDPRFSGGAARAGAGFGARPPGVPALGGPALNGRPPGVPALGGPPLNRGAAPAPPNGGIRIRLNPN